MALKPAKKAPKVVEPVIEAEPVVEAEQVVEPVIEIVVEAPKRETRTVVLQGRKGSLLHGAVNGAMFALPCGIEVEVTDSIYNAVSAYIIEER